MSWSILVRTAMLGAERSALSERLASLGINAAQDPVLALLKSAARYRLLRRAAGIPVTCEVPALAPADLSEERPCSRAAARALGQIIDGPYHAALIEWVELAIYCQCHAPAEHLPSLFELCKNDEALWGTVSKVIGPRGYWLLEQHPLGAVLQGYESLANWHTESREQRTGILMYWRRRDPMKALELLASGWQQESPADRQALLAQLHHGLSLADEPFLESCLDDKRKEIRQLAAKLLSEIPESALSQRLFQTASQALSLRSKNEVQVKLPAEAPAHLLRDGIKVQKAGDHEWLWQLLSRIPPSKWGTHFGYAAETICLAFYHSNWSRHLIPAIAKAALQFKANDWLGAIAGLWLHPRTMAQDWKGVLGAQILAALPREAFNDLLWQAIQTQGSIEEGSLADQLLLTPNQRWDDKVAMAFIKALQERIAKHSAYDWGSWHYRNALGNAAYTCHPRLLESMAAGWPVFSPAWGRWEAEVKRFQETMRFRKEMREAFQ